MRIYLNIILLVLTTQIFGQKQSGFFDFTWDEASGRLMLDISEERLGERFLYVNSLAAGVGSNDIGLDRGQLGDDRVVYFYKSGNKILLMEDNLKFRAISENKNEVKAVEEAFAKSVVWGFKVEQTSSGMRINLSDFLMRDAHGLTQKMASKKQGTYKLDKSKSAIYKEALLNFPKNSEFEAIITFTGQAKGKYIKSVAPNPDLITVRMHHSFVELPDGDYRPRQFMPESGFNMHSYYDYAVPIDQDLIQRFITRHRLEKKFPERELSEAIEPIVYYLDNGCPEPIRSALIEGASWWNEAFEVAGFINAFQVKVLPDDAHPLDVRYNMIQWVHRSTRGWSYGASVRDPRTGEIIKGHVSLGSLRVRQDFMIAQGIVSNFNEGNDDPRMLELALARLRQLSAHEVGHTLGLAHNFAASYNDRASVMDYPHPLIYKTKDDFDFNQAYSVGIGEWDKRAITYGYSYPLKNQSETDYLYGLIDINKKDGLLYITDQDARPAGGLHAFAHLWDNGNDPIGELNRISTLRDFTLSNLGNGTIKNGTPYSELEKKLVPVYLMHRYQVDAVSKMIAGVVFDYSVKKNDQDPKPVQPLSSELQLAATNALLATLEIEFLKMPDDLLKMIPPPAFGYARDRETFKGNTGSLFDPIAAAEASANHTLKFLLNPERLTRLAYNYNSELSIDKYLTKITDQVFANNADNIVLKEMLQKLYFIHLLQLSNNPNISKQVNAQAIFEISTIKTKFLNTGVNAHKYYLANMAEKFLEDPAGFKLPEIPDLPPGSPIGCH